jgi:hypothetical protein
MRVKDRTVRNSLARLPRRRREAGVATHAALLFMHSTVTCGRLKGRPGRHRADCGEAVEAGSKLSATIQAFSSSVQRCRRPMPVITSIRRKPSPSYWSYYYEYA